eukprot:TRINITY_DN70_c1_g1_i1.p1 TRINITY_DN70_c1_g1~~TRINITY_DN70_c1_g1_i1.p1  ORF type:complete len:337 (-),score=85.30 TRINITY_DN70_c1_g1_i1:40-1050(-)
MVAPSETVFIGDLHAGFDDAQVLSIFGAYGTIKSHTLLQPSAQGTRAVIITFATVDEAKWMVDNLNGNIPQGLTTTVSVNYKKGGGKGGKADAVPGGKGGDWGPYGGGYGGASWDAPAAPSANVFIGELPAVMDDAMLLQIFSAYGGIESHKLMDAGQFGKRAAIISFKSVDEAAWIVNNLNGNIPQGLAEPIRASFKKDGGAKGFAEKGYGYGAKGGGKGKGTSFHELMNIITSSGVLPVGPSFSSDECALFVGGLPHDCTDRELYQMFSVFGAIAPKGLVAMPGDDGYTSCKGYGFVTFMEAAAAQKAIVTLNGTQMPDGKTMQVSIKQRNQSR